jgi:hypothetical protein
MEIETLVICRTKECSKDSEDYQKYREWYLFVPKRPSVCGAEQP